jgi:hypothetical protein
VIVKRIRYHLVPVRWLFAMAVLLLVSSGCRRGVPVIDTAPKPAVADGTLSGTVRGPEGTSPVAGRVVDAVNVQTGERYRAITSETGGFTFKVTPGKYRVELALRQGETIVKQPGVIAVGRSDIDAHADFIIGSSGLFRPRYHAPRGDDGLGAAIASANVKVLTGADRC